MDQQFLRNQLDAFSRTHQVIPLHTPLIKGLGWTTGPILGSGTFEFLVIRNMNEGLKETSTESSFLLTGSARILAGADGTLGSEQLNKTTQIISRATSQWLTGNIGENEANFVEFDDELRDKLIQLGLISNDLANETAEGTIFQSSTKHFLDQLKLAARMRDIQLTESTVASLAERFPLIEMQRFGRAGLEDIKAAIPEEISSALRSSTGITEEIWQYYTVGGELGIRRRQAAQSFPLLAAQLAETHRISVQAAITNAEPLAPVIQQKLGLSKPVVKRLPKIIWATAPLSTTEALKALNSCPPDWVPQTEGSWRAFCEVVFIANRLSQATSQPSNSFIKNTKGKWEDTLLKILQQLPSVASAPNDTEITLEAKKKNLEELQSDFTRRSQEIHEAIMSVERQVHQFRGSFILPLVGHQAKLGIQDHIEEFALARSLEISGTILFEGKNIPDAIELGRKWSFVENNASFLLDFRRRAEEELQQRNAQLLQEIEDLQGKRSEAQSSRINRLNAAQDEAKEKAFAVEWPSFFGGRKFVASNGLEIVCLTSTNELVKESFGCDEGEGLGHCVGEYVERPSDHLHGEHYNTLSLTGKIAILSIRERLNDHEMTRKATIEVDLSGTRYASSPYGSLHPTSPSTCKVVQLQGPRNRRASKAALEAFEEMQRAIKTGTFIPEYMNDHKPAVREWKEAASSYTQIQQEMTNVCKEITEEIAKARGQIEQLPERNQDIGRGLIGRYCGYDWSDEKDILTVWKVWTGQTEEEGDRAIPSMLSSKWKNLGLERLANGEMISAAAEHLNPHSAKNAEISVNPIVQSKPATENEPSDELCM